jgi:hypothetical protein
MNEDLYIGVVMIGYIVYIVLLNWVYIKEYLHNTKGVIKRGNEWPE